MRGQKKIVGSWKPTYLVDRRGIDDSLDVVNSSTQPLRVIEHYVLVNARIFL